MCRRIFHQIRNVAGVNVRKSKQTSRKVCWIVVCSEDAAKLFIKHTFGGLPKIVQKIDLVLFNSDSNKIIIVSYRNWSRSAFHFLSAAFAFSDSLSW